MTALFTFPSKAFRITAVSAVAILAALPASAQEYLSPANPISTMPITATFYGPNYDGSPAQYTFSLTKYDNLGVYEVTGGVTTTSKATYHFGRVPPGQYVLNVQLLGSPGNQQGSRGIEGITVTGPGADTSSALQGQYSFLLKDTSHPGATAAAGSFTADGAGKITAGVVDIAGTGSSLLKLPVKGIYQLNAAGQGTATLTTSQGTISLSLFVPTNQTLTNITSATVMAAPGGLVSGSGTLLSQGSINPAFAPTLYTGVQAALSGQIGPTKTPVAGSTQFTFLPSGTVTTSGQLTVGGGPVPFQGVKGTYSPVDSTTGRTTLTFAIPGQPSMTYAAYKISDSFFYVMSLSQSGGTLLAGAAQK